jgi:uncharacterized phage-like protein YoqJ
VFCFSNRLVTIAFLSKAQRKDEDKIYWTALEKYTYSLGKAGFKKADEDKIKTIYLEKPDFIDSIPSAVNDNQRRLYKEHNKHLLQTKLFPVSILDSVAKVSFVPYRGKLKSRNHYMLSISDGTVIYFKFDCYQKKFVFYKVENWGI